MTKSLNKIVGLYSIKQYADIAVFLHSYDLSLLAFEFFPCHHF